MSKERYRDINSDLIRACKKGNSKAQFKLYKLYYKSMYNVALRMIGDTAEAEDIMQESFLKAFSKIETYKGEVAFGAWLKRIVVNKSLDFLKSRKSIISIDSNPEVYPDEAKEEELSPEILKPECLNKAILTLPEGYRVVLTLYLIEGYDHDEISGILGISSATSRTQYSRAKKKLAQKLTELKAVS